jgi:hypothetical protein
MKSSSSSRFPLNDAGCFSFSSVGRGFSSTFILSSGLLEVDILMVRISISASGSCFSGLLKNRSVGSESSGAVSKLSCVSVVSGSVSGRGVDVLLQDLSSLNSSKLIKPEGSLIHYPNTKLLLSGSISSSGNAVGSFTGDSLGALKTFLGLGGVSISDYLASWERRDFCQLVFCYDFEEL